MPDLRILNVRHRLNQPIVPDRVEGGGQIQIDPLRLALEDGRRHPRHRVMRVPLRSVAVRAVVKVRVKDRFQDERERPLHHAIPDGRYP